MIRTSKIGRNNPCPCGSGKKYKFCCFGKTDWQKIQFAPVKVASRHLSLRGKNIGFLNSICGALQLDSVAPPQNFAEIKRAFGPRTVQAIHSAVQDFWPDLDDFERCLRAESGTVTALYGGRVF
jgi:SEC-C motif